MGATAILAKALQLPDTATRDEVAHALAEHLTVEPAAQPSGTPDLSDMVNAMAVVATTVPLQESADDAFHRLAELRARVEGTDLATAYSRQSASTPELWDDVRDDQPRY